MNETTEVIMHETMLPCLKRIQLVGLRQHTSAEKPQSRAEDGSKQLFEEHVKPHFKSVFADPSRYSVVCLGDTPELDGLRFHVPAFENGTRFEGREYGIVDQHTEIFTNLHPVAEFSRVHVVPFSDTLPSAYDFDLFRDYVEPFFACHRVDGFQVGQTFYYNAVQFKVVAAEPCSLTYGRVGTKTEIFTNGQVHPTAAEFLSPDEARHLAIFPPAMQLILLERRMFGGEDIAERIMAAQSGSTQGSSLTAPTLKSLTRESSWSDELARETEQAECMVCLAQFAGGDSVRILPCKHVFHTACVDEWLARDAHCPLCRHDLHS